MAISKYFDAQKENLRRALKWEPFATIFPVVDKLYVDAIGLVPKDQSLIYVQFLLICHKSFLAATSLIGQSQPDDAAPITRRAIEVARFAAAVKTNPEIVEKWMAYKERMQRWTDRQKGEKPKPLRVNLGEVNPGIKPTIDDLMMSLGIISDAAVHFTPEYFGELGWDHGEKSLKLDYFTGDQRALEREIVSTSGTHLQILEVLDWCLDGALKADPDWIGLVAILKEKGAVLAAKFDQDDEETRPMPDQ